MKPLSTPGVQAMPCGDAISTAIIVWLLVRFMFGFGFVAQRSILMYGRGEQFCATKVNIFSILIIILCSGSMVQVFFCRRWTHCCLSKKNKRAPNSGPG